MKDFLDVLAACELFGGIDVEKLPQLVDHLGATLRRCAKKQDILAEGDACRFIGVVLQGAAQVTQLDHLGNRSIMGGLGAGDLFGEAFACAGVAQLPVTVTAVSPCAVMLLDSARILQPCDKGCGVHQQLIGNLVRLLAMKNILFHRKLEVVCKRTTRDKLLTYLDQQARLNSSSSFDIPFNRQELADYLEVERSGLSAQIGQLQREGVLVSRRRHFELL